MLDVDLFYARPRPFDSGEADNYDPSYAVLWSDSPESDNRLHTMGNGTSFFSRHGTSLQRMHMPHGAQI